MTCAKFVLYTQTYIYIAFNQINTLLILKILEKDADVKKIYLLYCLIH